MPLLALLLVLSASPQDPAISGSLDGLWWGGLALPDEFETVTLELRGPLEGGAVGRGAPDRASSASTRAAMRSSSKARR